MIGGLIVFAVLVAALAKVIAGVFNELGKMFSSFGIMAQNFAGMLWGIAQVVFWLAVIVFAIAASVYSTYKYIKLVKRGTEIMAEFEHKSLLLKLQLIMPIASWQPGYRARLQL